MGEKWVFTLNLEPRLLVLGGIWGGKEDGEGTYHHGRNEQGIGEGNEGKEGGKLFKNPFSGET